MNEVIILQGRVASFTCFVITDVDCEKCAELSDEVCHLISQLSDVEFIQQDLRKKLSTTKSNLATSIDRESKLRCSIVHMSRV